MGSRFRIAAPGRKPHIFCHRNGSWSIVGFDICMTTYPSLADLLRGERQ